MFQIHKKHGVVFALLQSHRMKLHNMTTKRMRPIMSDF